MQTINITDKFDLFDQPKVYGQLSSEQYKLITERIHSEESQLFLKSIYEDKKWLCCGCEPKSPTSIKYLRGNDRYVLARVPYRNHHTPDCIFHVLEKESSKPMNKPVKKNNVLGSRLFNAFSFEYDFPYRTKFKHKLESICQIEHDDPLYLFVNTLISSGSFRINGQLSKQSFDSIENNTPKFMLNKQSLRTNFSIGSKQYYQLKNKLKNDIAKSDKSLPVGLALVHGVDVKFKPTKEVVTFKSPTDNREQTIKLPKGTVVTSVNSPGELKGPILFAMIVGKTGTNRNDNSPYIGPLHVLALPVTDFNSFNHIEGKYSRTLVRSLYTSSKSNSTIKNTVVNKHITSNHNEILELETSSGTYIVNFCDHNVDSFDGANNIWVNTKELRLSDTHDALKPLITYLSGTADKIDSDRISLI